MPEEKREMKEIEGSRNQGRNVLARPFKAPGSSAEKGVTRWRKMEEEKEMKDGKVPKE